MSAPDLQAQIDAARAYESLFVPALFGQWAAAMADAAQLQRGQSVLDVACGTGVLASEAASRVRPEGHVAGLDPNPGMLAVAAEKTPSVDWHEGSAENMPFSDTAFDAVVSQFGLMFFRDRHQSIREMLRVLKPSGRLVIAVWDAIENLPGYSTELRLIERLAGVEAAEAVRAPFVLGGVDDVRTMVQEEGAVSATVETHSGTARFPNIRTMVEAELRGWLPVMGVHLREELIETILREAEPVLAPFTSAGGTVIFAVTAHVITAQKQ
jgi:SAM-dependent methyltransferase